ncbi:glucuronokinase 1-like isoform X2 [Zingiber officinale]|uniref:glucuronokinase 1-like isoform X2 n=1 Tax=Zingiber officinale TaxID=94328 RepID=UPI001C4C7A6D|nr:glucuronokinase 1-like isoform X2 [Zingiber officinale]
MAEEVIERRAYARIGLLGNPSDVYFGRTISLSIANFSATVRLEPSQDLVIRPHPFHDLVSFSSIRHLVNRLQSEGYYGGVRLLMATCKIFYKYCCDQNIELKEGNFTLSYDTNIPRQTGLSGSSAIVCAAFNCLLDFYKVRHLVKVEIRPDLILNAEKELGIVAGLQDRVAQVYGGLVYMVLHMTSVRNIWTTLDMVYTPPWILVFFLPFILYMLRIQVILGRQMFGDDALGSLNIKMIEVARSVGAACKFTGSGGAAVAFCPEGPAHVQLLEEACNKAGFTVAKVEVVPPVLGEEDLKTVSVM